MGVGKSGACGWCRVHGLCGVDKGGGCKINTMFTIFIGKMFFNVCVVPCLNSEVSVYTIHFIVAAYFVPNSLRTFVNSGSIFDEKMDHIRM